MVMIVGGCATSSHRLVLMRFSRVRGGRSDSLLLAHEAATSMWPTGGEYTGTRLAEFVTTPRGITIS
jgi:hypothetical protein